MKDHYTKRVASWIFKAYLLSIWWQKYSQIAVFNSFCDHGKSKTN